jgi:predicted ATP-grasp superfamily ATP-dependent carboligase
VLKSRPTDASFADEVAALVDETGAGSIMPIAEGYHRALIDCRDRFEPEVHVFSPSAESFNRATDKDGMHGLCTELAIPVAEGMTLDALLKAPANARKLRFPLVLRTRNQNASEGVAPWKAAYARDETALSQIGDAVCDIAENVLVQEYHPGAEDHVQVLMHDGEAFMTGEYIGEHHMPLAGGVTVQRVTCRHECVITDAVKLLKALKWEGIAGVQFHYDPGTQEYIFLEVNPRFIGGLPTVIMAGFDAPFLLWQSRFEPEAMRRTHYRLGMRTRILGGDANWMLGMLRGDELPPGQKRIGRLSTLARFFWNFGPWTHDDVFWWRDPKPLIVDWKQMLHRLGSRSAELIDRAETGEEGQ